MLVGVTTLIHHNYQSHLLFTSIQPQIFDVFLPLLLPGFDPRFQGLRVLGYSKQGNACTVRSITELTTHS